MERCILARETTYLARIVHPRRCTVILRERLQKVNKFPLDETAGGIDQRSTHSLSLQESIPSVRCPKYERLPIVSYSSLLHFPSAHIPSLRRASTIDVASIDEQTRVSFEERTYDAWDLVLKTHQGSILMFSDCD